MIPKVIHYCWYGGSELPDQIKRCINTWEVVLPDYEIVRHDESNLPTEVKDSFLFNKLYQNKKWAKASDYARMVILKENPGIYLDTDIFMVQPFTEEMLNCNFFAGCENLAVIALGVVGVKEKNDKLVEQIVDTYNAVSYDYVDSVANTRLVTDNVLKNIYGIKRFNKDHPVEIMKGYKVFPEPTFYPISWDHNRPLKFEDYTIAIHEWTHFAESDKRRAVVGGRIKSRRDVVQEFINSKGVDLKW